MQIEDLFRGIRSEAFRLELLDCYHIKGEWEQFQQFKKGKDIVADDETEQFYQIIRRYVSEGKKIIRVHVIPKKPTDYLKFEIKTGYVPQLRAGAKIYLLYQEEYNHLLQPDFNPNDFWLFDNRVVVELIYDKEGHFLKERSVKDEKTVKKYTTLKKDVIDNGIPLEEWLEDNPNF